MNLVSFFNGKIYAASIVGPNISISKPMDIVNAIVPAIYGIAGVAVFGFFVYGGFLWITSTGEPDKIKKATDTMINAVIGAAIVVFAYLMTRIVSGILGYKLV
ncbi:hypothetical protein JW887_06600 [Candidatus Dojkabacteria bacterium]|nr:hypothetical protein [Candidatus Dojkabacteria bacterium]